MAPVSCICCRSWLKSPVVSSVVVRVFSILCRSWLQAVARGSSQSLVGASVSVSPISCRSWLQSPVSSVVHVSSTTTICRWWLHWLSLMAPVSCICCCSGICRSWHQYHLLSRPVAPVAPAMASVLSIVTSCGSKLSLVAPVAAMVVFLPMALTGSHLVFW